MRDSMVPQVCEEKAMCNGRAYFACGSIVQSARSGRIASHRGVAQGFTLIEILVVMVIVAVLAVAVSIGIATAGGERHLSREAERFQALVSYACTRAELSGHEIGLRVDENGYAFTRLALDGWQADEQEGELRPRRWLSGMQVSMRRDGREMRVGGDAGQPPQIICFSSGELTPFVVRLALGDVPVRYELSGRSDGRVTLERVEGRP